MCLKIICELGGISLFKIVRVRHIKLFELRWVTIFDGFRQRKTPKSYIAFECLTHDGELLNDADYSFVSEKNEI